MDLTKAIEKIEANRVQAEASFVFCLWKDPQRYDDYKNINEGTDKTLICEEQVFYFMVGRGIRRQGFSNIEGNKVDATISITSLLIHIWRTNPHSVGTTKS